MIASFEYPPMTLTLATLLRLRANPPNYEYDSPYATLPNLKSQRARETWEQTLERLREELAPQGEPEAYDQALRVWRCRDETQIGDPVHHQSPSGQYQLTVTQHRHPDPGTRYSRGTVRQGDRTIAVLYREQPYFPFAWLEGHPEGDFLIAHMDGPLVLDLPTGCLFVRREPQQFLWHSLHPSPTGTLLAIQGRYLDSPLDVQIFDLQHPTQMGWRRLGSLEAIHQFGGWTSPTSCRALTSDEVVDLPGHPLDGKSDEDCTPEEGEAVEAEAEARRQLVFQEGEELPTGWKKVLKFEDWTADSE